VFEQFAKSLIEMHKNFTSQKKIIKLKIRNILPCKKIGRYLKITILVKKEKK
jgi:hypothetical protein